MKRTFYALLPLSLFALLFSCGNVETQSKSERTEPQQDTPANKSEVYIHSIDYRRVLDCPVPHIIDVTISGLQKKDLEDLNAKYDRCKLATPDDSVYVDLFLPQNDHNSTVRFHSCCFLMDHSKNEIHTALKKARITFYNDSTKYEISNSVGSIETAYMEVIRNDSLGAPCPREAQNS